MVKFIKIKITLILVVSNYILFYILYIFTNTIRRAMLDWKILDLVIILVVVLQEEERYSHKDPFSKLDIVVLPFLPYSNCAREF